MKAASPTSKSKADRRSARMVRTPAPDRPDLDRLIKESSRAFDAMSPGEREEMMREQRRNFARGQLGMMHPDRPASENRVLVERAEAALDAEYADAKSAGSGAGEEEVAP